MNRRNMIALDNQMYQWGAKLRDDLKISSDASRNLATTISIEISTLPFEAKQRIIGATPVPLSDRLEELQAFQNWMDYAKKIKDNPALIRAQVITQIYICFVYLGESWFKVIRKESPIDSTTKKCCKYLTENPVRAFRNAIAHANWRYKSDFSGMEYWARKGNDPGEPLSYFEVADNDLAFWQMLSRCTAYASILSLKEL